MMFAVSNFCCPSPFVSCLSVFVRVLSVSVRVLRVRPYSVCLCLSVFCLCSVFVLSVYARPCFVYLCSSIFWFLIFSLSLHLNKPQGNSLEVNEEKILTITYKLRNNMKRKKMKEKTIRPLFAYRVENSV
ncbi:unnamed protein product [Meloidogyne enterolobii]|uniref:Uncharacterized protein n=1 Tax=Meloidogyne enterolobii TaxID=390850 RepID=A0ACB0Z8A3_MELEN